MGSLSRREFIQKTATSGPDRQPDLAASGDDQGRQLCRSAEDPRGDRRRRGRAVLADRLRRVSRRLTDGKQVRRSSPTTA